MDTTAGMRHVGEYQRLDEACPITVKEGGIEVSLTAEAIVRAALRANYGVHRLLSELVQQSAVENQKEGTSETPLMRGIRERLNAGDSR